MSTKILICGIHAGLIVQLIILVAVGADHSRLKRSDLPLPALQDRDSKKSESSARESGDYRAGCGGSLLEVQECRKPLPLLLGSSPPA